MADIFEIIGSISAILGIISFFLLDKGKKIKGVLFFLLLGVFFILGGKHSNIDINDSFPINNFLELFTIGELNKPYFFGIDKTFIGIEKKEVDYKIRISDKYYSYLNAIHDFDPKKTYLATIKIGINKTHLGLVIRVKHETEVKLLIWSIEDNEICQVHDLVSLKVGLHVPYDYPSESWFLIQSEKGIIYSRRDTYTEYYLEEGTERNVALYNQSYIVNCESSMEDSDILSVKYEDDFVQKYIKK